MPAAAAPKTPSKEVVADSPSTKASTGVSSEPASPMVASPAADAPATPRRAQSGEGAGAAPGESPKAAVASPTSAVSTTANTGPSSTLATPRGTRKQVPGPIGHSVLNLSNYSSSPRYSFRPPARDVNGLKVPGPGSYETPRGSPGRAASLAPGRKAVRPPDETPGPGTHDAATSIGIGPKHSLGRPLTARGSDIPGPGSYEAKGGLFAGPKYSVGLPRQGGKSKVPGPGTYDHEKYTKIVQNAQYSIPLSPRARSIKYEEMPGPGAHGPKKTSVGEGPKFSHGLPQKKRIEATPGPGDYGGHYTTFHMGA